MAARCPAGAGGRGDGSSRRGFTLIETLAVLVVLAILGIVIASRFSLTGPVVAVEAQVLRSHLRYVQGLAMANNVEDWSLSVAAGSYTVLRDGATAPINLPGEDSPTHTLPAGVAFSQGAGTLPIDEWGSPDQTRTLRLTDGQTQASVTIFGLTGLIR